MNAVVSFVSNENAVIEAHLDVLPSQPPQQYLSQYNVLTHTHYISHKGSYHGGKKGVKQQAKSAQEKEVDDTELGSPSKTTKKVRRHN